MATEKVVSQKLLRMFRRGLTYYELWEVIIEYVDERVTYHRLISKDSSNQTLDTEITQVGQEPISHNALNGA